jgi:transcriptional antiterminator RfaH
MTATFGAKPMPFWAVAQTETQRERTAQRFLQHAGFETYLPLIKEHKRLTPLFSAYLFVELDEAGGWSAVDHTVAVLGLLRAGDLPAKLPEDVIPNIRAKERDGIVRLPRKDKPIFGPRRGDPMLVLRGSFADHVGLYDGALAHERVAVLLSLLGRQVRVELERMDLRRL